MTEFSTVEPDVPRDRYGRPMVVPPGGGKAVPYTRCTTYVKVLEDTYNLEKWKMRMTALGLVDRPDLMLSVAAHRDEKERLNQLVDQACEAAKAGAAATTGTALHKLTERGDRGQDVGVIPDAYKADLAAYAKATECLEIVGIERFTVEDELRIGGTHDRTVVYAGERYIADVKTGSVSWGMGTIAMQLAVYAHSVLYDFKTQAREPLNVNQDRAIVIHLPAGEGECTLQWVNIKAGWDAVQVATKVRAWRARKDLSAAFELGAVIPEQPPAPTFDLDNAIVTAPTVEALNALWAEHHDHWTDEHTQLAAARKALLQGGLVTAVNQ